ncbi:uncharacterized protein FIESC28_02137 [Fusarium coffeatum]|uniref:Fungal N-terminal domain-containing protein n=1 Tax=Fusarium coffeatum TaxID=231269 RepID=A0A366S8Q6_9HYPO|nr:uncharacterized protein FIESC28_02137 [Fusarium coffeatum]RBR25080.1 hypothetical protein FIESC28_02137 [Fusarium coffeatum]
MEVVGSVAATLQLAQALGVTVLKVREAYSQIKGIDDLLHDFDGQLDATRTVITILDDVIGNGKFDASTEGAAFALLEEVADRLTRLESLVKDTRNDLKKRKTEPGSEGLIPPAQSTATDKLLESLELDLSRLTSSQNRQASLAEKHEMEARLAPMQDLISQLRAKAHREKRRPYTSLSPQEIRDKAYMEDDTRSMLEVVNELVGSTKDYTSTIDSLSTASKVKSPQSRPVHSLRDRLEDITEWVDHTGGDDGASAISSLSGLSTPPSETITTSTAQTTATTGTENSFRDEMNQRRIRAVKENIKAKHYKKAIDLLEVLLSEDNEPLKDGEQDLLYRLMAKATVEGESKVNANIYTRRPLLKLRVTGKECRWKLMQATEALDQGDHDAVLDVLGCKFQFEEEWDSLGLTESDKRSVQKIQLARGESWFYAKQFWDIAATVRILERLLEDTSLSKSDRAMAHQTLTKAYRAKYDYKKSKFHGEQAYQNMIDIVGRDGEELHGLIQLLVDICSESEDPDRDIWKEMLPEGLATSSWSTKRPFKARDGLDTCFASKNIRHLHKLIDEQKGPHRLHQAVELLQQYYHIPDRGELLRIYDMLCWDCLQHSFEPHSILGVADTPDYEKQDFSCKRHQAFGTGTRGFSIIHFFAIAKFCWWEAMSHFEGLSDSCLDEISILLHSVQLNEPEDLQWPGSRSIDTGSFRMHDLVNRPMDLQLPKGSRGFAGAITVTPVWAAALSGKPTTVSFFLSLQETDTVRGANSILLLDRHEHDKPRKDCIQDVLKGILEIFETLPVRVARQLLSHTLHSEGHWCFIESWFLDKVLDKSGKDSADLLVWSPEENFRKVLSKSLLAFFFVLVTLDYEQPSRRKRILQPESVLQTLLKHSQATDQDSSAVLIDLISDVIQEQELRDYRDPSWCSKVAEQLGSWIDLVIIYVNYGRDVGSASVLKLERCIDDLAHWKQRMKRNIEEESTISRELKAKFRRAFGILNKKKRNELLDRKLELESERPFLADMVTIKERLEGIVILRNPEREQGVSGGS